MALLANGLETLEIGATAWRLIINANLEKLYSRAETDNTFVKKSGATMTGALVLAADPTVALGAATKQYVDAKVTVEAVQDLLASSFSDTTSINFTYDDTNNIFKADAIFGTTTGTIAEGSHTHSNLDSDTTLTGATIYEKLTIVKGAITAVTTRTLTPSDIGASKADLTYSVTLSTDLTPGNMDTYNNFVLTLGASIAINNPTNHTAGQKGTVVIKQDATGSRAVTWGTYYLFPNGTEPTLSTAANAIDTFSYYVLSATEILITGFSAGMA